MLSRKLTISLSVFVILIAQLACNAPGNSATPDTFATLNGLYTASAQTLEAAGTQTGYTVTPGLPLPTATVGTSLPATNTVTSGGSGTVSRCDAAQFLGDVTYPDGSLVARNNTFVKIWRIKNVGTCTWTTSYALVFTGGDPLSGPSAVALAGTVNPGQYIEIPVTFTAPGKDGNYRGYWKLRNTAGTLFGIGNLADTAFWVDIRVGGPSYAAFNFANSYCSAEWSNGSTALPCPGADGDSKGFVLKLDAPKLEDGSTDDEPGLLTFPQDKNNGFISGQFPSFTVQAGDRFRTLVNCQYNAKKCNVTFRLDYKVGGNTKTLASWQEVYEGKYYPVDLDLSSLAGQTVKFILVVSANGGNNNDFAIWLNPHIIRQGNPPPTQTPSQTQTPTATGTGTLTPTITATSTATSTFTPTATSTETPTPTTTATP
ncbi:MAG: hypothetical protein JNM02_09100 [Anaerolineales bacterium]|nr:hypothetical protein [Anaerolineales bacterium]